MNYNQQKYGRPTWKRLAKAVGELDYRLFKQIVKKHQSTGGGGGIQMNLCANAINNYF